jgi:hypothetical protein
MHFKQFFTYRNPAFYVLLCACLWLFVTACARKAAFATSSVVPAARGYATIKRDKNRNYVVQVQLNYLAEPTRLEPPKKMYVVWIETENHLIQNIGQIKTSNNLKATFQTASPFKPIKIFLTAEDEAAIQYPGSQLIISTEIF